MSTSASYTASVPRPASAADAAAGSPSIEVQRAAFYLQSEGDSLFAWLHQRADGSSCDHGVIICPPIGCEQVHAHRTLRHLADAVARQKLPVLRVDSIGQV